MMEARPLTQRCHRGSTRSGKNARAAERACQNDPFGPSQRRLGGGHAKPLRREWAELVSPPRCVQLLCRSSITEAPPQKAYVALVQTHQEATLLFAAAIVISEGNTGLVAVAWMFALFEHCFKVPLPAHTVEYLAGAFLECACFYPFYQAFVRWKQASTVTKDALAGRCSDLRQLAPSVFTVMCML